MKGIDLKEVWSVKLGNDQLKSLEYVEHEEILLTTSHDKKVKIWSAEDGSYSDCLQ